MSSSGFFAHADALPLLLLVPVAWFLLYRFDSARARRLKEVAGPRTHALVPGFDEKGCRRRRRIAVAALLLALVALLQPHWGEGSRRAEQRGVDILICLDVSRSMLARDLPPSRLLRARKEIRALSEGARGDRLGLVLFAGGARQAVPLTQDLDSFADLADLAEPADVALGGTDLGAALETALKVFAGRTGKHEVVLLLTDGEDLGGRGESVARSCRARGISVHCVGFGSTRGSKIALAGREGESFLRDGEGNEVLTVMDPGSLRRIALAAGGDFVDAGATPLPLLHLYRKEILPMARKTLEAEVRGEGRTNRFQWPLLGAFILCLTAFFLTDRK